MWRKERVFLTIRIEVRCLGLSYLYIELTTTAGMATLTYLLDGTFRHEDHLGNAGKLEPHDVQMMIAGRGILHAEMPVHGPGMPNPTGLQLWIDLPREMKMITPQYEEVKAKDMPTAHPSPDVMVRVICGESDGGEGEGVVAALVRKVAGCWFLDAALADAGSTFFQRLPKGWNAFLYVLDGEVQVGDNGAGLRPSVAKTFHTAFLSAEEESTGVRLTAHGDKGARFVIVAGEPLNQPVVQYGPMVMNTQQEIRQAFMDYKLGQNGFENAHTWASTIGAA